MGGSGGGGWWWTCCDCELSPGGNQQACQRRPADVILNSISDTLMTKTNCKKGDRFFLLGDSRQIFWNTASHTTISITDSCGPSSLKGTAYQWFLPPVTSHLSLDNRWGYIIAGNNVVLQFASISLISFSLQRYHTKPHFEIQFMWTLQLQSSNGSI